MARLDRSIAVIAILAGVVAVTGCSAGRRDEIPHDAATGGQTLSQLQAALADIPGLSVDISGGGRPNVKGNTGYDIAVEVSPGYRIVDGPALITFLTESAWSVREGYMPNALITISVTADTDFDAAAAAAEAGWIQPRDPVPGSSGYTVAAISVRDGSSARARLGDWPGAVPATPTGVTATQ